MNDYRGLKRTLRYVRGAQAYGAVFAELLILLVFLVSSADLSLGGRLATNGGLTYVWAFAFALGVETSFIMSWVRVGFHFLTKQWKGLLWSVPLALGLSFIQYQPVAIQNLQQATGVTFAQAAMDLGVNLNFLVYARSFVAVFLGAVLAVTSVIETYQPAIAEVPPPAKPAIADASTRLQLPEQSATLHSPEYQRIKNAIASATVDSKLTVSLQDIAIAAKVGHSTVRKHAGAIKQELGIA